MVSTTLASVTLAFCALMPSALGQEEPVQPGQGEPAPAEPGQGEPDQSEPEPEAQEFTVKWSNTNDCTDGGGDEKVYTVGECVGVPEETLAIEVLNRPEECVVISFTDDDCNEEAETLDDTGCWALQERYSVVFQC